MPTGEARIETERPSRYLVQLCRHASKLGGHRRHGPRTHAGGDPIPFVRQVEWSDTYGVVRLGDCTITMRAGPGVLAITAEAADEADLQRVQGLIAGRLEMFGRRDDLQVIWDRPGRTVRDNTTDTESSTPTVMVAALSGRRGTVTAGAVGALAVAAHLVVGGTVLVTQRWIGWTVDIVIALVVVKLLAVTAVVLRRRARQRNKASSRCDDT